MRNAIKYTGRQHYVTKSSGDVRTPLFQYMFIVICQWTPWSDLIRASIDLNVNSARHLQNKFWHSICRSPQPQIARVTWRVKVSNNHPHPKGSHSMLTYHYTSFLFTTWGRRRIDFSLESYIRHITWGDDVLDRTPPFSARVSSEMMTCIFLPLPPDLSRASASKINKILNYSNE